jgi:hypothetical protein
LRRSSLPASDSISRRASWLNLVERCFREITGKAIRRGSFESVPELIAAIQDDIAASNTDPKSFVWTKTAGEILEKVTGRG